MLHKLSNDNTINHFILKEFKMGTRIEHDFIGELEIADDVY